MSTRATDTDRLRTGVRGLDTILRGGLVPNAIYIVSGRPGSGKTILSNQLAFQHVADGGRVVYATLLAETHGRMFTQLRGFTFFDEKIIGKELVYLNGLTAITEGGFAGLLELVRRMVRDHKATLLVLDGMVTAETLADPSQSSLDSKKFITELQTWVGVVGCTVVFATSAGANGAVAPEHTMVDGIIELTAERVRLRSMRYISVTKLRGTGFLEGQHSYLIRESGLDVYPRMEAQLQADTGVPPRTERVSIGVGGLDAMTRGGLVSGSTTLILGSSGAGKTVLGLQFLAAGAANGEPCLHFGFYEPPTNLIAKADRLGLDFSGLVESGSLFIKWFRPAELHIDAIVEALMRIVAEKKIKRLFIDGFVGFWSTHHVERISSVFSAVSDALTAAGVTTMISDETRELFVKQVEVPTENVSAIFHNIIFFRQVELDAELVRLVSVMKTRDSDADRRLWRYEIGDAGVDLLAPFAPDGGTLMSGIGGTDPAPLRKKPGAIRPPSTAKAQGTQKPVAPRSRKALAPRPEKRAGAPKRKGR